MRIARANVITNGSSVEFHMNPGLWNTLRPFRCRVTLRGVIVTDARPAADEWRGVVIPWERVYRSIATVRDEADGRQRQIVLALSAARVMRVARRLRRRAIDRAWRDGSLMIREVFTKQRRERYEMLIPVLLMLLGIGWIGWLVATQSVTLPQMPDVTTTVLLWGTLGLLALGFAVIMIGIPVQITREVFRHNARSAVFTAEAIEAALIDGTNVRATWRDITSVSRSQNGLWTIMSPGSATIRIRMPLLSRAVLERVVRDREPGYEDRQKNELRRMWQRCWWWCALGGIGCGAIMWYSQRAGLAPQMNPWAPLLAVAALSIGLPGFISLMLWMSRFGEKRRRPRLS